MGRIYKDGYFAKILSYFFLLSGALCSQQFQKGNEMLNCFSGNFIRFQSIKYFHRIGPLGRFDLVVE